MPKAERVKLSTYKNHREPPVSLNSLHTAQNNPKYFSPFRERCQRQRGLNYQPIKITENRRPIYIPYIQPKTSPSTSLAFLGRDAEGGED
jgi:hypothetical protein